MVFVLMASMDTHVSVRQDGLESTVILVCIGIPILIPSNIKPRREKLVRSKEIIQM